jgi:DNA-binding NarL/FixJ family response regulator
MTGTITIVAADDHSLFLDGLSSLLEISNGFKLLGVGGTGDELIHLIDQYSPDIALVDISMPGSKIEEIIKISEISSPNTQLIALTMHLEAYLAKSLLELGLSGYVLKENAFDELMEAIHQVHAGEQFLSSEIIEEIQRFESDEQTNPSLTKREKEVLINAAHGCSNKKIALLLNISERTVRFHISNSCIKLRANGRANAVAIAIEHSLIKFIDSSHQHRGI